MRKKSLQILALGLATALIALLAWYKSPLLSGVENITWMSRVKFFRQTIARYWPDKGHPARSGES
ncbi:MAG: hypothetical protein M5U15_11335 [Kiritimatiellae bacterium]|nr:hypothetical protein [Kiritimatiellia bacterium]